MAHVVYAWMKRELEGENEKGECYEGDNAMMPLPLLPLPLVSPPSKGEEK